MIPSCELNDVTIEITRKCPMRCVICSSEGGERDPNELSLAELCKVVDDATRLGAKLISLSGGEPLESPHAIEFIRYVKNKGLQLHLYTCGNIESENGLSEIDYEKLQILKTLAIDRIIFSIHGPNEQIHEKITTKKGSYNNLISSIMRAREVGHIVELHFVPVLSNYQHFPRVVQLAADLGITQVSVLRFVPQGRGKTNRSELEIPDEKVQELKNILYDAYVNSPIQVRLGSPLNCFDISNQTQCNAGINKVAIRPDGFVYPCVSMKNLISEDDSNDIRQSSIEQIWKESKIFKKVRGTHELIRRSDCTKCVHYQNCKGGCITQRFFTNYNELMQKDPYCSNSIEFQIGSFKVELQVGGNSL